MRRSITFLILLHVVSLGCNRPPAGYYETITKSDVPYVERGTRKLCMDIVVPKDCPSPRPAVLLFHGGGWIGGVRSDMRQMTLFLASMGYVSATATYRLCDKETHYPAPVQDAFAALKFLRSHAAEYGLDADRIAVGGESAGGQLALLVGLAKDPSIFQDDSYPGIPTHVAGIIDIYGPTLLGPGYEQSNFVTRHMLDTYLGCPPSQCPERWREASPVTHVSSDSPPVLIIHGDCDSIVRYEQSTILHEALAKAGATSRLVRITGAEHGWGYFFSDNTCMRTLPAIADFLAEYLRSAPRRSIASP